MSITVDNDNITDIENDSESTDSSGDNNVNINSNNNNHNVKVKDEIIKDTDPSKQNVDNTTGQRIFGKPNKKKVDSLYTSTSKQDNSASVSKSATIITNNNNNEYDNINTNNNIDNGITSSSISKPSPFGGGNAMVEAVAKATRKKANLQKRNNNNIDNDITSSSNTKPNLFESGNAMAAAVTKAAGKKANLQKLSSSGSITSLHCPKSNKSNNNHDDTNNKERINTNQLRRGVTHASIAVNTLDYDPFRVNETITTNNNLQKQRKHTTFFQLNTNHRFLT